MIQYKIPEEFLTVITKMNLEISNVEYEDFITQKFINPSTFDTNELIRINVNLHMNREHKLNGTVNTYSDILTNLFKFTYPDYNFISFQVSKFSYPLEKTNRQKFHELFSVS
jgi:hypothetical protein